MGGKWLLAIVLYCNPLKTADMLIFLQSWCKAHHWEDGSLVREVKLVLWLKEDVLLRRH